MNNEDRKRAFGIRMIPIGVELFGFKKSLSTIICFWPIKELNFKYNGTYNFLCRKLKYYLSLVTMKNARWFINIYHWKANYKPSHIEEGCEDDRVNLKLMKKSTAI